MMMHRIAVPSDQPGGLDARVSDHFGHCDAFTLVTVVDGVAGDVAVLPAPDHDLVGCLGPIDLLTRAGATVVVATGMGRRPLDGLKQRGIPAFRSTDGATVAEAIRAFAERNLPSLGTDQACGGGDCH